MSKNKIAVALLQTYAAALRINMSELECGNELVQIGERQTTLRRIRHELQSDTVGCFMGPEDNQCFTTEDMQDMLCESVHRGDQSGQYCQDKDLIRKEYSNFKEVFGKFYEKKYRAHMKSDQQACID